MLAHNSCWPLHLPGTSGHSTGDMRGERYIIPRFSCGSRESRKPCASLRLRGELRNQCIGTCRLGITHRDVGGQGFMTKLRICRINSYKSATAHLIASPTERFLWTRGIPSRSGRERVLTSRQLTRGSARMTRFAVSVLTCSVIFL